MKKLQKGFTLIELMIVVAIIAILAAIALPAYNQYRIKAANNACQGEAKAYMNSAVAAIMSNSTVPAAALQACASASGTGWSASNTLTTTAVNGAATITFVKKSPGSTDTKCNAATATCHF